jgi:MFS family permease
MRAGDFLWARIEMDVALNARGVSPHSARRGLWLGTLAWVFGAVWFCATSGTPVTNAARSLGASEFQFGLLTALPFLASLLSLPASLLIEATGKRKGIFLIALYFQRGMWVVIALLPLAILHFGGPALTPLAMTVFLWLIYFMHGGQAVGGPAWVSWMADFVPDRVRGKYFSRRRAFGVLTGVPAAWLCGYLLDRFTSPTDPFTLLKWCAGIFIVAAIPGLIDIHLFRYVPDIPRPPTTGLRLLKAMRRPLHDKHYLWFAGFVATLYFAVSFTGQFVTRYVMEVMSASGNGPGRYVNTTTQMIVIVVPHLAMMFFLPSWGKAVDKMGKKPVLAIASLGLVPVGLGWCLMTAGNTYLGYVLSALGTVLFAGVEVANMNMMMEMAGTDDENGGGSAYPAVNTMIINIAGCLGGLSSGLVAQSLKDWHWVTAFKTFTFYDVLFAGSAFVRLLAVVVFLPHIHEAGARPVGEAIRFVTANVYNNLSNAVQQPFRWIGALRRRRPSFTVADAPP